MTSDMYLTMLTWAATNEHTIWASFVTHFQKRLKTKAGPFGGGLPRLRWPSSSRSAEAGAPSIG